MGRVRKDKGAGEHIYLDEFLPPVLSYSELLCRLFIKASFSCPRTAVAQKQTNGEKDVHVPLINTRSHTAICLTSSFTPNTKAHNLYLSNLGKTAAEVALTALDLLTL